MLPHVQFCCSKANHAARQVSHPCHLSVCHPAVVKVGTICLLVNKFPFLHVSAFIPVINWLNNSMSGNPLIPDYFSVNMAVTPHILQQLICK